MNIRDTVEYKNCGYRIVTCPICGEETLDTYWICENCFWEYDGTVKDDDYSDANLSTVADYKKKFLEQKSVDK